MSTGVPAAPWFVGSANTGEDGAARTLNDLKTLPGRLDASRAIGARVPAPGAVTGVETACRSVGHGPSVKSTMAGHTGSSRHIAARRSAASSPRPGFLARLFTGTLIASAVVAVSLLIVAAPLIAAWRLAGTLGSTAMIGGEDRVARSVHLGPVQYETAGFATPNLKDPERLAGLPDEPPPAVEEPQAVASAEVAPSPPTLPTASVHTPKPGKSHQVATSPGTSNSGTSNSGASKSVATVKVVRPRLAAQPTSAPAPAAAARNTWSVASLFDSVLRPQADTPERDETVGSISAYAPTSLPREDDHKTAVYDISGHTVYMPNGERLEAHSGLGEHKDNPASYKLRMRGPTPPNVYRLTMRERLFHGVAAIRLNPIDHGAMNGRDGMLAHTYMLGPRGDSNGCVSFRDYSKFLVAFRRGEVNRMIVVSRMTGSPASVIAAHRGFGGKFAAERGNDQR
jgi:hypothetical protein